MADCVLFAADSIAPENSVCNWFANLGRKSPAASSPDDMSLSNSVVVMPIARAAIWNAPGSRSPNWPRSSSALTLPLLIICWIASSAPADSSADMPNCAAAIEIPVKISFACWPSIDVPRAAAENLAYSSAVELKSRPSLETVARTNSSSEPTLLAPTACVMMLFSFSYWSRDSRIAALNSLSPAPTLIPANRPAVALTLWASMSMFRLADWTPAWVESLRLTST